MACVNGSYSTICNNTAYPEYFARQACVTSLSSMLLVLFLSFLSTYYTVQIFGGYKFCELPQFCFSWNFLQFSAGHYCYIYCYIAEKIFAIE